MAIRGKGTGRAASLTAGLAAGAAVSMLVTTIVCCLGAWLISSEILPQDQIGYCSLTALLLSAMLGSITAMKKVQRKKLMVSMLSGAVYYGILMGITIVFFDGRFQGMGVTMIAILTGCAAAALLSNQVRKGSSHLRRRKIRR